MIRINGTPLRIPDTMAFKYVLPPGDLTPATLSLLEVEASWRMLTDAEVKDVLRSALGQCTCAVADPATGGERTFAARLQTASLQKTPAGWHDVTMILEEVPSAQ